MSGPATEECRGVAHFLYLLMRDHVPTGVVAGIAQDVMKARDAGGATYTSESLKTLAENYAVLIIYAAEHPQSEGDK